MAKLSFKYDKDVVESLVRDYGEQEQVVQAQDTGEDATAPVDPLDDITRHEATPKKGQRTFKDIFGYTPKTIPNLPFTVFDDNYWHAEARMYIPAINPNWVWNKGVLEQFALAFYEKDTTLLHGLQGTGKSCLVEQWCAALRIPFWRMSCNRETREQHFTGSAGLEYDDKGQMSIKQEPTILTDSLKYGGVFCEDEAFRHNSALVLQSLREKSNRTLVLPDAPGTTADERKVKAPENWWYAMTDNTCGSGDETGVFDAEVQDASTLDRIDSAIMVKYLPKGEERRMLKKYSTLNETIINGMLDVAGEVRKSFAKQSLMCTMSVRALIQWADKIQYFGSIGPALKLSWYNKLGTDDQKIVDDIFFQVFARKIND
jgi:cobaltochelatase CobS